MSNLLTEQIVRVVDKLDPYRLESIGSKSRTVSLGPEPSSIVSRMYFYPKLGMALLHSLGPRFAGAYVLTESEGKSADAKPDLILVATGSEVEIAMAAASKLEGLKVISREPLERRLILHRRCLDSSLMCSVLTWLVVHQHRGFSGVWSSLWN